MKIRNRNILGLSSRLIASVLEVTVLPKPVKSMIKQPPQFFVLSSSRLILSR